MKASEALKIGMKDRVQVVHLIFTNPVIGIQGEPFDPVGCCAVGAILLGCGFQPYFNTGHRYANVTASLVYFLQEHGINLLEPIRQYFDQVEYSLLFYCLRDLLISLNDRYQVDFERMVLILSDLEDVIDGTKTQESFYEEYVFLFEEEPKPVFKNWNDYGEV